MPVFVPIDRFPRVDIPNNTLAEPPPADSPFTGPLLPPPGVFLPLGSRPAPSTTSITTTTSILEPICPDEFAACFDDPDCLACMSWSTEAGPQQIANCPQKYFDVSTDFCSSYSYAICCAADFVTAVDCAENTVFVDAMLCQASYVSLETGGPECTTFSCLPASTSTSSEQGDDDDRVSGTADDDEGSDSIITSCTTETEECFADEECTECWRASLEVMQCEPEAFTECANDYVPGYIGGVCESITPRICCPDEINGNGNDCSGNTLWTSYEVCTLNAASAFYGEEECGETFTTCGSGSTGGGGGVDTDDDAAKTSEDRGVEVDDDGDDAAPGGVTDGGMESSEEPEGDGEGLDTEGAVNGAARAGSALFITVPTLVLGGAFLAAPFVVYNIESG